MILGNKEHKQDVHTGISVLVSQLLINPLLCLANIAYLVFLEVHVFCDTTGPLVSQSESAISLALE